MLTSIWGGGGLTYYKVQASLNHVRHGGQIAIHDGTGEEIQQPIARRQADTTHGLRIKIQLEIHVGVGGCGDHQPKVAYMGG